MTAPGDAPVTAADLPERFNLASEVPTDERIAAIRAAFPEAMRDGKIDFDALRRSLGDWVEPGPERFGLTWPGKADCMRVIQAPSIGTLIPTPDDSVDWDRTENVIIEGDNLEVLKLLQKAYYGKVKLIYIDPPYNTGKEFIYPDNFREGLADYLRYSGQTDQEGVKLTANAETDGRYHSKWLSMMYPRLFLARNLLREDGSIFVSIDSHEVHNLCAMMNEVFGEENQLAIVANVNNPKGRSDDKYFATAHEYLVVYGKGPDVTVGGFPPDEVVLRRYRRTDADGSAWREIDLRKTGDSDRREDRPNLYYCFMHNPDTGDLYPTRDDNAPDGYVAIRPLRDDDSEGRWRWELETAQDKLNTLFAKLMPRRGVWSVFERDKLDPARVVKPTTAWTFKDVNSERGSEQWLDLGFDKDLFPRPKPRGLIRRIMQIATDPGDLVLDFFAGSGTTAQAALELSRDTGSARRTILVQLPERTGRQDFPTIAAITRERARRAAAQVASGQQELGREEGDLGFRAYTLMASNFRVWTPDTAPSEDVAAQLTLAEDHVRADAEDQAILIELLLKAGYPLTAPVEDTVFGGVPGFAVAGGALLVCLSRELTIEAFEAMAECDPAMILVLDAGFGGSDELKVNAVQTVRARNERSGSDVTLRVV
jgi:adenine-specific DNA-methyltransferase